MFETLARHETPSAQLGALNLSRSSCSSWRSTRNRGRDVVAASVLRDTCRPHPCRNATRLTPGIGADVLFESLRSSVTLITLVTLHRNALLWEALHLYRMQRGKGKLHSEIQHSESPQLIIFFEQFRTIFEVILIDLTWSQISNRTCRMDLGKACCRCYKCYHC